MEGVEEGWKDQVSVHDEIMVTLRAADRYLDAAMALQIVLALLLAANFVLSRMVA